MLVLEAPKAVGWKEGVQAVVAELLTTGRELNLRAARARSRGELEQELQQAVASSGASAGVSVLRDGASATALICRPSAPACERVEVDASDDELSRSRLALAVVESLRPLDLSAAAEPPARSPERPPAPVAAPRNPTAPAPRRSVRTWVAGGVVLSSGISRPPGWLTASLGIGVVGPWGLELGVGGAPLAGRAESYAGSLSLRAFQATAFATFEPSSRGALGFALGLGGGAVRLETSASPVPGFDGISQQVTVGVVSARARLFRRFGAFQWGLLVDPGMLVPAVRVDAGTDAVLRFGRPWVALQTSLGVEL